MEWADDRTEPLPETEEGLTPTLLAPAVALLLVLKSVVLLQLEDGPPNLFE